MRAYINYMKAKPFELESIIKENPIAYVPFGALEWHGVHNVLGVDSIKATEICKRCVEITGGILFPCVNNGAFGTMKFPYTFHFNKHSYIKMTKKLAKQIYKMGFRIIIFLTGHYPKGQIGQVRKAAIKLMKKHKDCFALGIPEQYLVPDFNYFGDHGASWETSIMMEINPDHIDLDLLPDNLSFPERARIHGILGKDPKREASREIGKKVMESIVKRLSKAVLNTLKEKKMGYFNEIYHNFRKEWKKTRNLKRIFEIHGIQDKKELWEYIKWFNIFGKRGRYDPNYKYNKKRK